LFKSLENAAKPRISHESVPTEFPDRPTPLFDLIALFAQRYYNDSIWRGRLPNRCEPFVRIFIVNPYSLPNFRFLVEASS